MTPIRVLVSDLPEILVDVLAHLLEAHPDILVVGRDAGDDLAAAVHNARPHVVILGLTGKTLPAVGERLLRETPSLRVLGVARDNGDGFLYELRPYCTVLGELSAESLVDAVRGLTDPAPY